MHVLERIADLLAPHACCVCGAEGAVLCGDCAARLPATPPACYRCGKLNDDARTCGTCRKTSPLTAVWTITPYDNAAKTIIARLKYERAQAAAADIARTMAAQPYLNDRKILVTHVPTANVRVRQRGYDQASRIARDLAQRRQLPYCSLLVRVGAVRQVGASGAQRRKQLQTAFKPLKPYMYQNADVLLVDDVITTGSTFEAAARVLKDAGARNIYAIAFARA